MRQQSSLCLHFWSKETQTDLVPWIRVVPQRHAIVLYLEAQVRGQQLPEQCHTHDTKWIWATRKGPCSVSSPSRELQPGPPFNHSTTGSVLGSCWDSTNLRTTSTFSKVSESTVCRCSIRATWMGDLPGDHQLLTSSAGVFHWPHSGNPSSAWSSPVSADQEDKSPHLQQAPPSTA